ncbi:MAG: O-antigen ligase family protein [Desulfobacteraceae bacterium]|nr:O-antigen ligase family protein [Desulfobacteraceae bacterium]
MKTNIGRYGAVDNSMPSEDGAISITAGRDEKTAALPGIVWVIIIATGIACMGGKGVLGFKVSGLTWFIPMFLATLIIIRNPGRIRFPLWIWLPWVLFLVVYHFASRYPSLQRTVQLICPLVVGVAVSTSTVNGNQVARFIRVIKGFAIVIAMVAAFKTGLLLTGTIPSVTGLAAESMTALLLCCIFAAEYAEGKHLSLYWWSLMAILPVYALTRTAIACAGLSLPFTFAPLRLDKRIIFLIAALIVGVALFYSPRVQKKMFYSHKGKISDVMAGKVADSGRFEMWKAFESKIKRRPWLGRGTGAGQVFTGRITGGLAYPHNDWLLSLYDMGILGTGLYALTIMIASFHAWRTTRSVKGESRTLLFAGAFSFVILALMMITDNIMVYSSFFGNLQFTFLGIGYAVAGRERREEREERK